MMTAEWSPTEAALTAARALAVFLDRRARHSAVRAEYATIAAERLNASSAVFAVVEELAGVRGHGLGGSVAA
jgi:hypothetical protein